MLSTGHCRADSTRAGSGNGLTGNRRALVQKAENDGDEKQRGHCRHHQAADDGPAKGGILFTAFAERNRHW